MTSDIEIAQHASMRKISEIADALGLPADIVESYGHYKAKIACEDYPQLSAKADGRLILVTAISPTPAGEGKTTTTVGLGDALNLLGRQSGKTSMICLREPALGPVFGMKGGAAGGGYAQVVPMEDINLHFTGDFAAIAAAHNLLSALIDNHIHHGNALQIDPSNVSWKRVIDMNDRALRKVVVGLGGKVNGTTREDGFDIVVASEVMAIFCLADGLQDLKQRLGNIVIGYSFSGMPIQASDLQAHGAMAVLLKNAIKPNLVQTLENTPALIHGGPFANIAHGCNSVIATRLALKLADYVVTEAGFGADLGAEKFIDIKCRKSGLRPAACVIVATIRALKYHGGVDVPALTKENLPAVEQGFANLLKHVQNVTIHYGLPCVVCINRFQHDTEAEIELVRERLAALNIQVVLAEHWAKGGQGAIELAQALIRLIDASEQRLLSNMAVSDLPVTAQSQATSVLQSKQEARSIPERRLSAMQYVYEDSDPLWEKMRKLACRIYGAADIAAPRRVKAQLDKLQADGYGHYPICVAKTQYSFTTDATQRGAVQGHIITVREVRLCAGAEFVVLICDDIMTMPGLPKAPCAMHIDIDDTGQVIGLF